MLAAEDRSVGGTPWWPGVLGAWIFLVLGLVVLLPLGARPLDPLLSLDTGSGLSAWLLDPVLRGLISQGMGAGSLRATFFLASGVGILLLGRALRYRLEILPLSLVLFLLGTWPWALRDPASLLAAPHHLRLLFLGLMATTLRLDGLRALILPALLGFLRQGLVGGEDWQIDVLFLFLIYSILYGISWDSRGKQALYGLGIYAAAVFLPQMIGLTSGKLALPGGLSGFEDSNVDFGALLLYRPGFLLCSAGLIWFLLASGRRGLFRVFSSTGLYALSLVLFMPTFSLARDAMSAQDELMARDLEALGEALPQSVPEKGLLLIDLPLHLRPALLAAIPPEHWNRLWRLDTWDSGSQILLPPDFEKTLGMPALRYGPMGPMSTSPSALALLERFPRARLLSSRAARFPMRLEDLVSLGTVPRFFGSVDVEPALVEVLGEQGRQVSDGADLPELDPASVHLDVETKDDSLVLRFETERPRDFLVAVGFGRGRIERFDPDRDAVRAVSLDGAPTVLDYVLALSRRVGLKPLREGYRVEDPVGLAARPFAWVPGYGPVFLVSKTAAGQASFKFVPTDSR